MITHVKHLTEALQRFNPDARLSDDLDVQSVSPATNCTITSEGFQGRSFLEDKITELEGKIEDMEPLLNKIRDELDGKSPNISQIASLFE